jgi:hypothetical protein
MSALSAVSAFGFAAGMADAGSAGRIASAQVARAINNRRFILVSSNRQNDGYRQRRQIS